MTTFSLATALISAVAFATSSSPTVTLHSGTTLTGLTCPDSDDRCFFGIPYAAPPVGDLRFRPPENYEWATDSFLATEHGSTCV